MATRRVSDILLDGVVAVLLGATLLLSFVQVVARYVFLLSTPWSEELARLLFVWGVFLGAAVGVKRNLHTRVDFVFQRLSARGSAWLLAGMDLLVAAMAVVMILHGSRLIYSTRTDFSTSLGYPRNVFYLPVPVSGLLMLWYLVPGILRRLTARSTAAPQGRG